MAKFTSSRDLESILKKGEDYKTEFKEQVYSNLGKEMVAFANASGGQIYIGITDDGEVKDANNITNRLKSQIKDIANNCDPNLSISLQEIKKEKVLIVKVQESDNKPHKCSSGFYVRDGASSKKLSRDEIIEFLETEDRLKFDEVICKKFNFKKDFDKEKLFYFMDRSEVQYSRSNYIQLLENLSIAKREGSKIVFNNTGVLFFSKNLESIFPQAAVSCALFKGTEKIHVIDRKIFNKDIINNVEDSVDFLKKHLRLEYVLPKGQLYREEILEIPEDALREALINAVTHRKYLEKGISVTVEIFDDRVEIYNFGALPKDLKISELGKRSSARNPLIAQLMLRAGYIEKMGTGIKKMKNLVAKAGLKPINFEFTKFTTLIFYRKPLPGGHIIKAPEVVAMENLTKKLSEILAVKKEIKINELLQILHHIENNNFSRLFFSKKYNMPLRTLDRNIITLKENKLVSFEGSKKTGKYKITERYKVLKESIK